MEKIIAQYITRLKTFKKYYYLLTILVKKDLKKKYKGSFLGILWSLLNPLLNMIVITIVFSELFHSDVKNFPVYLLSGLLLFGFFSSSTTASMLSVISASHLINKVYIPKYIITLSSIISNFIFFLISLIDLVIIMMATKVTITINLIYAPIYLILFFVFCCGISLILATITVFFRDVEHIYGVLTTVLMYSSAVFYPSEIIPDKYHFLLTFNPVYYFILGFRTVIYSGDSLDPYNMLLCLIFAVISMIVGIIVFEKNQDKFILYM
ncbi:ABC transporter permease [Paenibacillus sp. LMG 31461]|uniref:Transport permease protein n=1 Tax=Paenibacillus plantarum TaxID=2654975 RepID=A0ABX1XCX1_9BACL|nr:ABC transporter permease [Paenibacillus plantarum]